MVVLGGGAVAEALVIRGSAIPSLPRMSGLTQAITGSFLGLLVAFQVELVVGDLILACPKKNSNLIGQVVK
jgi:hypothetical protein